MPLKTCPICQTRYFDNRTPTCPNPKCGSTSGGSTTTTTLPPPRKVVNLTSTPLSQRLQLPQPKSTGVTPKPKKKPYVPGETREYSKPFKLSSTVPGFEGVNAETFKELRASLAEQERKYAREHPEDPGAVWSVAPLLDCDTGPAKEMAVKAMENLKSRAATLEERKKSLSPEQLKRFNERYEKRLAYMLFEMSGTATRPGELGAPGRDAIREGINTVRNINVDTTSHSDIYFQLNRSMAIDDKATGARKDQFGLPRNQPVALPVLDPPEPRATAMPHQLVRANMNAMNEYITHSLSSGETNPIELMAKQYMIDVTIHPCVDANGRTSLLSTFPLAQKFGLPWPLVTKRGSEVFHCQNGQATDGHAIHPSDVMAYLVEGMSNNLALQEGLLDNLDGQLTCTTCGELAWATVEHARCGSTYHYCDAHIRKSLCEKCGGIGLKTSFVSPLAPSTESTSTPPRVETTPPRVESTTIPPKVEPREPNVETTPSRVETPTLKVETPAPKVETPPIIETPPAVETSTVTGSTVPRASIGENGLPNPSELKVGKQMGDGSHHTAYKLEGTDDWVLLVNTGGNIRKTHEDRKKSFSRFPESIVARMGDVVTIDGVEGLLMEKMTGDMFHSTRQSWAMGPKKTVDRWKLEGTETCIRKIETALRGMDEFINAGMVVDDFQYWITDNGEFKLADVKSAQVGDVRTIHRELVNCRTQMNNVLTTLRRG